MYADDKNFCLSFLTLSRSYLYTSKNILEQMIDGRNQYILFEDYDEKKNIQKRYEEVTKWSDFNTILPTLFLFYHGVETLLKGLLFLKNPKSDLVIKHGHSLNSLFNEIEKNYPELDFLADLKKYLICNGQTSQMLKEFIDSNNDINNIDDFYLFLRYPADIKKQKTYDYSNLEGRVEKGVFFAQELKNLIEKIILETVRLYNSNCN